MRVWLSSRSLVWMLVVILGMVAVTGGFIAAGYSKMIVPSPKSTGENFIRSLAAHRYEGALQLVSSEVSATVTAEELKTLVSTFEASQKRIDHVDGVSEEIHGDTASVQVEVTFNNRTRRVLVIPLQRENGLWKVVSIEPVWNLIQVIPGGKIVIL